MPAQVSFVVVRDLALSAERVFAELTNWRGHAEWVPMTRVEILTGDGGAGTEFVATSGPGPMAIADHMRVVGLDSEAMSVDIVKLGPTITGTVRLQVTPTATGSCRLTWREDIEVPKAPAAAGRPLVVASQMAFRHAIGRLERRLRKAS